MIKSSTLFLLVIGCATGEKESCAEDEYRTLDGDCASVEGPDDSEGGREDDTDDPPETGEIPDTGTGEDPEDDSGEEEEEVNDIPIDPASLLDGRTWLIDLAVADWDEPWGLGESLGALIESPILLGVVTASESSLDMMGAVADWDDADGDRDRDEQDPCALTLDLSGSEFSNPGFELGPATLTIGFDGVLMTIEETVMIGAFEADGASFDGELDGLLDTRPMAALFDPEGGDDAACDLFRELEYGTCETCPSDGEPYCLPVHFGDIVGVEVSAEIVEITEETLAADCAG